MLKIKSYRNKLILVIMPLIVLGLMVVGIAAYFCINNLIEDELSKSMLATTEQVAGNINTWLETRLLEPESIATAPGLKTINTDFAMANAYNLNRAKYVLTQYPDVFLEVSIAAN